MKIAFYAPFKPLGHPNPSGDLTIATGLHAFLSRQDEMRVASTLRARWIYLQPWRWPTLIAERIRARERARGCDVWLTYHTYYKAPDLLGPAAAARLGVPYAIFQGIYSTKRRRDPRTWPGFLLNRRALTAARLVFTNKREDHANLLRLLPAEKVRYVAPGIFPEHFPADASRREELRRRWRAGDAPVILTAAMFRDDVKTQGLTFLIKACGDLARAGRDFRLALAGDGATRPRLEALARERLGDRAVFLGKIPRAELPRYYAAADLFAFPGIRESLGMVYLEAQCCGLPVAAFGGWGVPEVVADGRTGLLTPPFDRAAYAQAMAALLDDVPRRQAMGRAARERILEVHDLNRNYGQVRDALRELARKA